MLRFEMVLIYGIRDEPVRNTRSVKQSGGIGLGRIRLTVHGHEEFLVGACHLHTLLDEFHSL